MVAPGTVLRVLHAPGHAPDVDSETVKKAEETGADLIFYSEAYRVAEWMTQRSAYRTVVGLSGTDTRVVKSPRGDAGDNPIGVRRDHKTRLPQHLRVTPPGTPRKYAPERWVYAVECDWSTATLGAVCAHPSPLFCGLRPWRLVMKTALARVAAHRRHGALPILAGDLQTGWMAERMLKAAGLKVWREHIDFIAYDPGLRLVDRKVIRLGGGMDHPWLLGTFVMAR